MATPPALWGLYTGPQDVLRVTAEVVLLPLVLVLFAWILKGAR